jgi:hypothetical protein
VFVAWSASCGGWLLRCGVLFGGPLGGVGSPFGWGPVGWSGVVSVRAVGVCWFARVWLRSAVAGGGAVASGGLSFLRLTNGTG